MMRSFAPLLLLIISLNSFGQNMQEMSPEIGNKLDFGPEIKKKWEKRNKIFEELYNGDKLYDDLTAEENEIIMEYSETYESMWDVIGGGCSWYCGGGPMDVTASSYLASQGQNSYEGRNAHDLSYETAWVEGDSGYGIGEYLTYTFAPTSPRINKVKIANGYVKSHSAWSNNSRVKKLKMYVNDQPYAILNLEDVMAVQNFKIEPIGNSNRKDFEKLKEQDPWSIKFEILEVYKGAKYADVAITEIFFDGLDVHCFVEGTKITMADSTEKNIEYLKTGDKVLSFNPASNSFEASTILELANPYHDHLIEIQFKDGTRIVSTKDHPFFDGKFWRSFNPLKTNKAYEFEMVKQLQVGTKIIGQNSVKEVVKINHLEDWQPTYTIVELDRNNSFIANDLVVGVTTIKKPIN